jgi:iron complex outermembrane receptor protein
MGVEVDGRLSGLLGLPGLATTRVSAGFVVDGADTPESGDKPPLAGLWDWGARLGFSSLVEGGSVLVHGSLSRRTRVPALRELYSGALGRFEPNPALRPEVLTGGEIGATITSPAGELQIVAFHQRLTDGIVRTSVEAAGGENRFKRVNRDGIRSTGLELFASGGLGPARVSGDLTLQDVRAVLDSGEELEVEYEPTAAGRVGLAAPLAGATEASVETRFRSSQFCENPEAGGLESFETDPQVDLSLRRIFRVGGGRLSRIDAVASVDNVTDAAVFDQCGLPQPRRTLSVRLRLW